MFRKTAFAAALALAAPVFVAMAGFAPNARADGDSSTSNIAQTLQPAGSFGENAMALGGVPRLEVIAGMGSPVVVYDGPSAQNFAAPATRSLRVVPNDNGSFSTLRG